MRIIDSMPQDTYTGLRGYNWDELFDGQVREMTEGQDFTGTPIHFGRQVRRAAARLQVDVKVKTSNKRGLIWIQAIRN